MPEMQHISERTGKLQHISEVLKELGLIKAQADDTSDRCKRLMKQLQPAEEPKKKSGLTDELKAKIIAKRNMTLRKPIKQ